MGNSPEQLRRQIIDSGSPLNKHSINCYKLKQVLEGQRRINNGHNGGRKVVRAEQRHERLDERRQALQVDRILARLEGGQITVEDLNYLDGRGELVESNCDSQISFLRIDRD